MRRLYVYILLIISFLFVLFGSLIGQKKWIEHKQRVQQRAFFENLYANRDCIENIVQRNGMYIDPIVFYNVFVTRRVNGCSIETVALGDINEYEELKINSRMQFLNVDKHAYKERSKGTRARQLHQTEESFNKLIDSFNRRGYDYKISPILINKGNFLIDGRHRMCILMKKYDKNHKIKVLKVNIDNFVLS